MKRLMCVALILCLALSDIAMAAGGGGAGGGGGGAAGGGVGAAGGVSGGGWYGGYVGDTGGRRRTYRANYPYYAYRTYYPYYSYHAYYPYPYQHHARQLTHDNHGRSASFKKKTVGYAMAAQEKVEHYHFRHALRAEITLQHHNSVSAETATKQIRRDKHTLSPGTPLLGLDPRSPRTWALYSQMLPFVFSEARR